MKPSKTAPISLELNLPTPTVPLRPHSPARITWKAFMEETAERTRLYLSRQNNREDRIRVRHVERFVWH